MVCNTLKREKEILYKISKGDQIAFTLLFDWLYQDLANYIYRITESNDETEEIIQEVFIKVWEKREMLQSVNSIKSYVFILSKHRTFNYLRDKAKKRVNELKWSRQNFENSYELDQHSLQDEYNLIIHKVVLDLPPQQQRVYQLSRYENLKYDEIASQMGLSKETVKKHMQHALTFLKRNVKKQIENAISTFFVIISFFL